MQDFNRAAGNFFGGNQSVARDLLCFLGLAGISFFTGLLINSFREKPLPLIYQSPDERIQLFKAARGISPSHQSEPIQEISLDALRSALGKSHVVILDARSVSLYKKGHIPTAICLSRENFEHDFEGAVPILMSSPTNALIVYCADQSCDEGVTVARSLVEMGFKSTRLFKGGWKAWKDARLPVEL